MCGIIGIVTAKGNVINEGIILLNEENNRGEQGCGAVSDDGNEIHRYHGFGRVAEVFGPRDQEKWSKLVGPAIVMQTTYSTISGANKKQPITQQPIPFKFFGYEGAVCHNGNLVRTGALRRKAIRAGYKFKSKTSDTEVVAALLSISKKKNFLSALLEVLRMIEGKGAFSLVVLYRGKVYGVRDQNGIKPLCIIKKSGRDGESDTYIFASESSVFPSLEATRFIRSVDMGELVVLGPNGIEKSIKWTNNTKSAFCVCEFLYFANLASRFFGVSVYSFRVKAGEMSARKHPVEADVIIPIPESGRAYSDGFSQESGIPSRVGLVKSRFAIRIRTFMETRETNRALKQRTKLQAIPDVMEKKVICLNDDTLFRASVAPWAVKRCREHGGARGVHFRVCSPPVKHCCHLGTDIATKKELVASYMTVDQIRDSVVLSDTLDYLTVEELKDVIRELGLNPDDFCLGCFTGEYPVAPPCSNCKNCKKCK